MLTSDEMNAAINEQIGHEFAAMLQYAESLLGLVRRAGEAGVLFGEDAPARRHAETA